jgi:hypothetical protein
MHRFTLILVATAVGASALLWTNAVAQTDTPGSERSEYRQAFEAVSGGHYFGEDEPEEVKRLAPNELRALLSYGSDNFHRAQAKGQVAQLRNRLDKGNALTSQQAQLMERILIVERDRQEREVKEQYASYRISGGGGSWTGMTTLASDELGISVHDQLLAQIEDFSRQQIAAVGPVLSAQQLKVYQQIQRERVAQQRSFLEDGHQSP